MSEPGQVVATVAQVVGARDAGTRSTEDAVRALLRDRQALLILDNFEHLLAAAPFVADLLHSCPGLTVLSTSRERLRLDGEHEVTVPPLSPPARGSVAPETVRGNAAVRLFAKRAGAIESSSVVTDVHVNAVAEICRRLDGLPLAIELAAAWSKVLTPPELLGRLDRRLPLLVGGNRDAPARQQTLRATLSWSHDRLAPVEQVFFRRLAVFAGGFTLAGAVEVAGSPADDNAVEVLRLVSSLVDKSLIHRVDVDDGDPRFGLLETVREFGLEQLAASDEEAAIRARHAVWCLRLAEKAEAASWCPDQPARFAPLQADYGNVRVALAWLFGMADPAGLRLAAAMGEFWNVRGPLGEARGWLDRALALCSEEGTPPELRARALLAAGIIAFRHWDEPRAEALLGESVFLWREVGDERKLTEAIFFHALSLPERDPATLTQFELALDRCRALGHPLRPYALMSVGMAAHIHGDDERAFALLKEANSDFRRLGDDWGVAAVCFRLAVVTIDRAVVTVDRGEALKAVEHALNRLDIFAEHGDRAAAVECLICLAGAAAITGYAEPAAHLLGAADELFEELGMRPIPDADRLGQRALIQAKLGDEHATTALAAGRSLSFDEAIAEARALADRIQCAADGAAPIQRNPYGLTPREREVLGKLVEGLRNPAIAAALSVSESTVVNHLSKIYGKLGVTDRAAAIAFAHRHGLV